MFYGNFEGEKRTKFSQAIKDMQSVFQRVYAQDNLITFNRNVTFFKDPDFVKAFEKEAITPQEKSLGWRLHTLCWAAKHCENVPGDFVECGVWRGFSFAVVTDYIRFGSLNKKLYLYDTYQGIPSEYNSEGRSNRVYEQEPDLVDKVRERFSIYPNVKVVQGTVPDSFAKECPQQISFLHIDMNSSKSEIAALEHLFDKVSPGGIIVFDDFGWFGYDKQTYAEIEFMKQRGHYIMELPTGQGMLIKR